MTMAIVATWRRVETIRKQRDHHCSQVPSCHLCPMQVRGYRVSYGHVRYFDNMHARYLRDSCWYHRIRQERQRADVSLKQFSLPKYVRRGWSL